MPNAQTDTAPYFPRPLVWLCYILGLCIHAQYSFFATVDYKGLTLNIADLLLPATGIFVIVSLLRKRSCWPQWRLRGGYIWLAVMTAIFTAALLNGYIAHDGWSHWALVNKYAGWFILLAYFGLGGWLVVNYREQAIMRVLSGFVLGGCMIALVYGGQFILIDLTRGVGIGTGDYLSGLAGNRNAYAFLLLATVIFASISLTHNNRFSPYPVAALFMILAPSIFLYDGSRAGFLALALILAALLALYPRQMLRKVMPLLLIGTMLFAIVNTTPHANGWHRIGKYQVERAIRNVQRADHPRKKITSEQQRIRFFNDSLALWQHNPVIGIGLGGYWQYAQEKYGPQQADIIDCTPLWLLTETGLIGFTVFAALFVTVLFILARDRKYYDGDLRALNDCLLLLLVGFAAMAVFHELLYQRTLWLMLGMTLALPRIHKGA